MRLPKTMNNKRIYGGGFGLLGALMAFMAVALGAFGAHALRGRLSPVDLATFETAVRYQMYHALGLILVAVRSGAFSSLLARVAGWAFTVGTLVFSGSLYVLVLTGERWLGAVTPVGGVAFLVGWGALAWSFARGDHVG